MTYWIAKQSKPLNKSTTVDADLKQSSDAKFNRAWPSVSCKQNENTPPLYVGAAVTNIEIKIFLSLWSRIRGSPE